MIAVLAYWKVAVMAVLVLAVGVQTVRLSSAHEEIAEQALAQAQFETDLATKHAEGIAEGAKRQQAAQALLDAARKQIDDAMLADARRQAVEARARADRLAKALTDDKWKALYEPLPEEVLLEFRQ